MGATTQTIATDGWTTAGNCRGVYATVKLSNSYATGGDTFTARNFGLGTIRKVTILSDPAGYNLYVDHTNAKIKAFQSAGFTPAGSVSAPTLTTSTNAGTTAPVYTNGGALTQTTGASGITGVQAPTFTGTAVAAAAGVEVGSTTDLSAVTADVFVTGW